LSEPVVRLRPATEADRALTFKWANDPQVRAASFFSAPITEDQHRAWYAKSLAGARTLYIVEWRNVAIGLLRLDPLSKGTAEIGITIGAEYRGRGFAVPALEALCTVAADTGTQTLVARIRIDNPRSRRTFERAGFRCERSDAVNGVAGFKLVRELDVP
jgi:RimJ/RimL family protein N-acetyltransferase